MTDIRPTPSHSHKKTNETLFLSLTSPTSFFFCFLHLLLCFFASFFIANNRLLKLALTLTRCTHPPVHSFTSSPFHIPHSSRNLPLGWLRCIRHNLTNKEKAQRHPCLFCFTFFPSTNKAHPPPSQEQKKHPTQQTQNTHRLPSSRLHISLIPLRDQSGQTWLPPVPNQAPAQTPAPTPSPPPHPSFASLHRHFNSQV